jgi:murein L,D-transpeptidase YcbB/YkuD
MNPLYTALSRGYARRRSAGPGLSDLEEKAIRANLDRARLIPALPGRYVIVDAGSARLWMIDGDKVEGPMRVIVGKRSMQTPTMAGYIRYVTLNPWWNVPPDLARERAKRVLKSGPGILQRENMELLSDWSDRPRVIPAPEQNVDLPEPVPVYITYLTALPDPARGVALQRDVYARDERRPSGRRA